MRYPWREQAIRMLKQSVRQVLHEQIKEAVDQMLEMDDAPQRAHNLL